MKSICSNELAEFNRIYIETDRLYTRYAAAHGISSTMLYILYSIRTQDAPCTQKQLTENWGIPMQTVNSCLKAMERKGIIQMRFADGSRKNKCILLTQAGEQAAGQIVDPLLDAENKALQELGDTDRKQLLRLTQKHSCLLRDFLSELR